MQKLFIFFIIISFLPGISKSQDISFEKTDSLKEFKLNEVIISANRTSTTFNEVASSISILTEQDIINRGKTSVAELLRGVEGVDVIQTGGIGQQTSVYLRGGKPHHTLILVDGVEVNDPSSITNSLDWAGLQTGNIERIEVLRGPQSTLYGSDALAGVISIFTKKGTGKPKLFFNGEGGSLNTYKASAGINGTYSFLDYSLFLSRFSTDGISAANSEYGNNEKDNFRNSSVLSRLGIQLLRDVRFDLFYNFNRSKIGLDQNAKLGDDPNFISEKDDASFKALGTISLFDKSWEQNIGFTYLKHIGHLTDGIDNARPTTYSDQYFNGSRMKFDWQNNFRIINNFGIINHFSTIVGVETETEKAYSKLSGGSDWGPYESNFEAKKVSTTGLYIQNQVKLFSNFFTSFGLRYDKHSKFGDAVTFRIAPAYFYTYTGTKIRATYGTAFKSPSVFYLYDPFYGNPDLNPEKSKGWDAGIDQYLWNERIMFGFTYYRNDFENMLGVDANYKTINIDKAELKGIEVFVRTIPVSHISLTANYTYTDSKDKGSNIVDNGKEIIRKPKNKIGFNLNYNNGIIDGNLEVVNIGERFDKDFSLFPASRVLLKGYTLLNISASYRFNKLLRIYGRIDNTLNEKFEEILYYGTPGTAAYLGLGINL